MIAPMIVVEPCASCKAPIVWAKMPSGKWSPFDSKPERRFLLRAGDDGVMRFATCKDAAAWRKPT